MSFAALVYGLALIGYVVLPLPEITPGFCSRGGAGVQLHPLQFVQDIRAGINGGGARQLLRNTALLQVSFNVLLFVPLGMIARHLFRRGVITATALGLGVSIVAECTQLTGDWFLYPCAYRLFDVDDLLAKTVGDLLLFYVIGFALNAAYVLAVYAFTREPPAEAAGFASIPTLLAIWLPVLVLFVVVPLVGGGASLGQRIVRLAPRTRSDRRPGPVHGLARSLCGTGGYAVLVALANTSDIGAVSRIAGAVSWLLVLVSGLAVFTTDGRRGLSGALTGLRFVDGRRLTAAGAK